MKKTIKLVSIITSVILIIGIFIVFTNRDKDSISKFNNESVGNLKESSFLAKKLDTTKVNLNNDVIESIESKDDKNAGRNIENYKKLIVELEIPMEYQEKIDELIEHGYDVPDIFTAYNFIYEKYGQFKDVTKLLQDKNKNRTWEEVFKQYDKENKEFVPSEFEDGVIDEKLKEGNLNINDIMIADKISQKGFGGFDSLIELRKKEGNWKKIKLELGILNLEEIVPSTAITSADVKKYAVNKNINEEKVINTLAIARKANIEDENLIAKLMNNDSKESIYSDIYENKYGN